MFADKGRTAMTSPYFLAISGNFKLEGYEPDGDSVRFIPDQASRMNMLKNHFRIKPSKDGSVQLRFEAIDATELHYGNQAQPLGTDARDRLVSLLGFAKVNYVPVNAAVKAANPTAVPPG